MFFIKSVFKILTNYEGVTKWYQSNPATVADCMFSAPSRGKDPEIAIQRGRCIPKWDECDTLN